MRASTRYAPWRFALRKSRALSVAALTKPHSPIPVDYFVAAVPAPGNGHGVGRVEMSSTSRLAYGSAPRIPSSRGIHLRWPDVDSVLITPPTRPVLMLGSKLGQRIQRLPRENRLKLANVSAQSVSSSDLRPAVSPAPR